MGQIMRVLEETWRLGLDEPSVVHGAFQAIGANVFTYGLQLIRLGTHTVSAFAFHLCA